MKNLLLAGLLFAPMALVACQSNDQAAVMPEETSTMMLHVSGMT